MKTLIDIHTTPKYLTDKQLQDSKVPVFPLLQRVYSLTETLYFIITEQPVQ